MAGYRVSVTGLFELPDTATWSDTVKTAASQTINRTADRGRAEAARQIRSEINFPARYLDPSEKRLVVAQKASPANLEGVIRARSRPTSLARFLVGTPAPSKAGVTVQVAPGKARYLKKAFVIRLRAGTASLDAQSNLGLAVRLKPGETLRNKNDARRLAKGLYLLYGPSVDQAFRARDGGGVASDIAPGLGEFMEREFLRLWELRRGG